MIHDLIVKDYFFGQIIQLADANENDYHYPIETRMHGEFLMVTAARTASQISLHMIVAFAIMYAFTGSATFGGLAALLEPICVVGILPLHDKAWNAVEKRLNTSKTEQRANAEALV